MDLDREEIINSVRHLEKIGYFIGYTHELIVEDSKFKFRDLDSGIVTVLPYNLQENFDDRDYTDEDISTLKECLEAICEYGIEVDIELD